MTKRARRVVITGLGILSSVGIGKERFWEAISKGRSGIREITLFNAETYPVRIAGELPDFDPQFFFPNELVRRSDRYALMGLAATKLALEDSKLSGGFAGSCSKRIGVRVGTVIGALPYAEYAHSIFMEKGARRLHPFFSSAVLPSSLAAQIGILFGVHGSLSTVVTACASGTTAIGEAFQMIRRGDFDLVIAGASESPITPMVLASFHSVGLLAECDGDPTKACRPFSKDRAGIVLSEGAAMVVLEELSHALERRARIYGEVRGYGESFDAYHTHHPMPTAEFSVRAIRDALASALLPPEKIDYINPHGSASIANDYAETLAIKKVFGDKAYRVPISSTKSMIGHALGSCGALEFVACVLMLEHQYLHPTINLISPDPQCDLDYVPNVGRSQKVDTILTMSSGFGGYNAACVLCTYQA